MTSQCVVQPMACKDMQHMTLCVTLEKGKHSMKKFYTVGKKVCFITRQDITNLERGIEKLKEDEHS